MKRIFSITFAVILALASLQWGFDIKADAAASPKEFKKISFTMSDNRTSLKEGNNDIGYYWGQGIKNGKNYVITYYHSATKTGKGNAIFKKTYNYKEFFETDRYYGSGCDNIDIYTNGQNGYLVSDKGSYGVSVYYGNIDKKLKRVKKFTGEHAETLDVLGVYGNKLYYSYYDEESGEKWDNDNSVSVLKQFMYNPDTKKTKEILKKFFVGHANARYLYCYDFWKVLHSQQGTFSWPDYLGYNEKLIWIYDMETDSFVKKLSTFDLGYLSECFENNLYYWCYDYDEYVNYVRMDYYEENTPAYWYGIHDKLIFKSDDIVTVTDSLGNIISKTDNISGYIYPLDSDEEGFATIKGDFETKYELMMPQSINIYDLTGKLIGHTSVDKGERLLNLSSIMAVTFPDKETEISKGNFKFQIYSYNLKTGNKNALIDAKVLTDSEVKKSYKEDGKIKYISLQDFFGTSNYIYWTSEYSMNVKYITDATIIGDARGVPEFVYKRYNKKTGEVKNISQNLYNKVRRKYTHDFEMDGAYYQRGLPYFY